MHKSIIFNIRIMPTKNELGEYTDGKIKTNFAKGDFNLNDSLTALEILQEKSPFFKKTFSFQNNKTKYKLAKILLEIINIYYNSDIIIDNPQKIEQLIKIGQKSFEEDIKEYINSFFNEEDTNFLKEKTNQPPYFSFFINGIKSFKIGIKEGRIELGHSYYYKEVFNLCMKEKERLIELFAIEHNPEKYLNIVIVDEAQDLTPIMTRLLIEYYKYAKENHLEVATVIVGDEKQSIYQFANRINSFNVIERELDKNNIKNLILNKTYRVPKKIASFTNEVCKKLNIYDKETELVSARKVEGEIIPNASLLDVVKNAVRENKKLIVLGRTNAEILIKYIKTMSKILKDKELSKYAKYIKVDSKYKKQFKKLLKDGIDAIDDTELIDKLKVTLGKNKITFKDIKNNQEDIKNFTPQYLIEFANLIEEMEKEEIEEILSIRPSTKPNAIFMTIHSSKGLESDEVYVLNGNINIFTKENKKEKTLIELSKIVQEKLNKNPEIKITDKLKPEENELLMEKYLLYVAFTRAKEVLYLENKLSEYFENEIEKTIKQKIKETPKIKLF